MFGWIKNTLPLWIFSCACFCLHGSDSSIESAFPIEYYFYEKEDCIKVMIVLPEWTTDNTSIYKLNQPHSEGVTACIQNDSREGLEDFNHWVSIEVNVIPSPEQGGVIFNITEILEKEPMNEKIVKDVTKIEKKAFFNTDRQVDFLDIPPRLTFSKNSPHIKYVRFFTRITPH